MWDIEAGLRKVESALPLYKILQKPPVLYRIFFCEISHITGVFGIEEFLLLVFQN